MFTPRQKHSLTSLWHILLRACSVLNSTLSSSVYKRKCLHLWGRGGGEEWAVEQAEQDSQWKKETETLAICEFGLKPNHCPQSPCTCLTASFWNKVQLLLPATPTTGKKRNHRQNTKTTKGKWLDDFILVSHLIRRRTEKCDSSSQYPVLVKFIAKQEQWSTPPTCKTETISYVMKQEPVEREAQEFMKDV